MDNSSRNLDGVFRALADPTRRAVVQRLAESGPSPVSVLAAPHGMALPSFMKHLGILEDAGLVRSAKAGRVRMCSLCPDALDAAERWFAGQRALWESRFASLDSLIDSLRRG